MTISHRERLIRKGKTSFIIRRGIIDWGLTTAVLYTFFASVLDNGFNAQAFIREVAISFVIFPISGVLFGLIMWSLLNRPEHTLRK